MTTPYTIRYDRRVSDSFLKLFLDDGVLGRLRVIAEQAALPLDLQMRKNPKTGAQWASLYVGLTSVLDVHATKDKLRFKAHRTWSENRAYGFARDWKTPMSYDDVSKAWPEIELYLERVIPHAVKDHAMTEGVVQTVTSKSRSRGWAFLDREVTPSFLDAPYKQKVLGECMSPLLDVTAKARTTLAKVPAGPKSFGAECDLLAVDSSGRLLAIEVKPLGAGTIAWVPAQATMYARVLQRWIVEDPKTATDGVMPRDVIEGMLAQRKKLGHSADFEIPVAEPMTVTPVVVLQRGSSAVKREQMLKVRDLLAEEVTDIPPAEIYEVSVLGDITPLQ